MTSPTLGIIQRDSFEEFICKVIADDSNWFFVRFSIEPCNDCIFSLLCPNISGYELFANKFNFCFKNKLCQELQ